MSISRQVFLDLLKISKIGALDKVKDPFGYLVHLVKRGTKIVARATDKSSIVLSKSEMPELLSCADFSCFVNFRRMAGILADVKDETFDLVVTESSLEFKFKNSFYTIGFEQDPGFPLSKEKFPQDHVAVWDRSDLLAVLSYASNFIVDSSGNVTDTLLELRDGVFLFGTRRSLSYAHSSKISGNFVARSSVVRKLATLLASASCEEVKLFVNDTHFKFLLGADISYTAQSIKSDVKKLPDFRPMLNLDASVLDFSLSRSDLLGGVKTLKHSVDNKSSRIRLSIGSDGLASVSAVNTKQERCGFSFSVEVLKPWTISPYEIVVRMDALKDTVACSGQETVKVSLLRENSASMLVFSSGGPTLELVTVVNLSV